jgi:ATP-dependent DNA helicase RecG
MENRQLSLFDDDSTKLFWKLLDKFPNHESFDLEYKSAGGGFPKDFWKSYSAFANTQGGLIVLGVKEKRGGIEIVGLSEELIHHYTKIFWDSANNQDNVSANLLQENDILVIEHEAAKVLAFMVPIAPRILRPVHLTRNPFGNTYKRNYEGDYCCSHEEVRRMLADADQRLHQDSRILEGYTMDDLDSETLRKYRQLFANVKPTHPWLSLADKEFLEKLGGYRKDRNSHKEGLTLAALLMFGKTESVTDLECAPAFFPDFREYLGGNDDTRWSDRIYQDGAWECNLFNFYLRVWPKLSSSLPKPFLLKEGIRKDETPAHVALRESFINALIHADYSAPGNIVIEHHRDHFVFSNPGTLLVSLRQYYEGGISECRNPNLQKMFLMVGTAEKAGSGVNKIMAGWQYAHWRRPFLRIENQPDRIVLELPMFSIIPDNTLAHLRSVFGSSIVERFGKNELTILATCAIEGEITNNRLQYLLDLHRTDITLLLQDLCKSGYLTSENKGRWTTYHLNPSFLQEYSPNKVATPDDGNVATSDDPNVATSDDPDVATSDDANVATSDDANVATSDDANVATSEAGKNKLTLNKPIERYSRSELYKLIEIACKDEFRSLEEIAATVKREYQYIRNRVIPEMMKAGLIIRLHPNIPNHPQQAYKATTKTEKNEEQNK